MEENPSTSCSTIFTRNDRFPSDVLKWMKFNAKPLMALKLMKVCKYFKHKQFPYFVVSGMNKGNDENWSYSTFKDDEIHEFEKLESFPDCYFWITSHIYLYSKVDPFSSFLSKIAVCEARHLYLENQSLTFDEFQILTACRTFECVNLCSTSIKGSNGKIVGLEDIFKCVPNVTHVYSDHIVPSFSSLEEAAAITLPKMKSIEIYVVREEFNFSTFAEFIKTHPSIHCHVSYDDELVFSPGYLQGLQEFVDYLISSYTNDYPPPVIHFPGLENADALQKLYQYYIEKERQERKQQALALTKK